MQDKLAKFIFLLKVSRPVFWPVAPILFLLGLLYSNAGISFAALLQAVSFSFPLCLFVFGINDLQDYESDMQNRRKGGYAGGVIGRKESDGVRAASLISGLAVAVASAASLNPINFGLVIILLAISYAYSSPPIRLKERPPFDSLSNGLMALLVFLAGYSFGADIFGVPHKILLGALGIAGFHAFCTIADCKADKKAGQRTLSTVFGKRAAALFAFGTALAAFAFGGFASPVINFGMLASATLFLLVAAFPREGYAKAAGEVIFAVFLAASAIVLWKLGAAGALG